MVDVHCHLLPAMDDGAQTEEEAIALARAAYNNGIRRLIVTPHLHVGRYDNTKNKIEEKLTLFKKSLQANGIEMQVGMAAEVRLSIEILSLLEKREIPFLGTWKNKNVLLLEMPHSHILQGTDKLIRWLLDRDILPMIAHPERNADIVRKFEKIYPFVEMGCLLQITSSSITGQFKSAIESVAMQLLEKGWVTVIASDAHNLSHRPPNLAEGWQAASRIVGEKAAWQLVSENPKKLTDILF